MKSDPEIQALIGQLNSAFFGNKQGDYSDVIEIAEKIISKDDSILAPYEKLGIVYQRLGDNKRSYATMRLAADLKQSDTRSWLECARMAVSPDVSLWDEAITCYNRAIKQLDQLNDKKLIIKLKFEKFTPYRKMNQFASIVK